MEDVRGGAWTDAPDAACATLIGIAIGMVIAIIKVSACEQPQAQAAGNPVQPLPDRNPRTPVVVQLLILYVAVFTSMTAARRWRSTAWLESGAYVPKFSVGHHVDQPGTDGSGRSLGLVRMTMRLIVLAQAIRNILPALSTNL